MAGPQRSSLMPTVAKSSNAKAISLHARWHPCFKRSLTILPPGRPFFLRKRSFRPAARPCLPRAFKHFEHVCSTPTIQRISAGEPSTNSWTGTSSSIACPPPSAAEAMTVSNAWRGKRSARSAISSIPYGAAFTNTQPMGTGSIPTTKSCCNSRPRIFASMPPPMRVGAIPNI